ncbi:hypothetical protein ACQCT6_07145 [Cytobacillus gottheilii]|uniref:Uncharacterized protein n=1 Tax=Cytobacillus gottheilii TaxID=859144 RepID=A0ABX8FC17_9BACI|nr:hypothetical protein [Cytobacillus gottheilii]QVY61403.1 hypothetical protein J1899_21070 [Cytobacillus gottheilii]
MRRIIWFSAISCFIIFFYLLYRWQLGAIPFFMLAIYFSRLAYKQMKETGGNR